MCDQLVVNFEPCNKRFLVVCCYLPSCGLTGNNKPQSMRIITPFPPLSAPATQARYTSRTLSYKVCIVYIYRLIF